MDGFSTGTRYTFNEEWTATFVDMNRSSNEEAYYFRNEADSYRVTLLYHNWREEWWLSVGATDGSHDTLSDSLIVPVTAITCHDPQTSLDYSFRQDTIPEGLPF